MSKRRKAQPEDTEQDPLAEAQGGLASAQAKLSQHDAESEALRTQAAALEQALDRAVLAGEGDQATKTSRDLAAIKEFIAAKIRVRKVLAQGVADAEAALQAIRTRLAQEQIGRSAAEKVEILTAVVEKIGEVCELLRDARGLQTEMDALATEHGLPTPPRQRLMLARHVIRSPSGDELLAALSPERTYGLSETPAL